MFRIYAHNTQITGRVKRAESAHCAIWALPHLFELELLDPGLIWCYGGAFNADAILYNSVRRVDGHLVVCLRA
jgi:hypothetical protein